MDRGISRVVLGLGEGLEVTTIMYDDLAAIWTNFHIFVAVAANSGVAAEDFNLNGVRPQSSDANKVVFCTSDVIGTVPNEGRSNFSHVGQRIEN